MKNLVEWLTAITSIFDRFFDRTGQLLGDLWDEFPNPLKMINLLIAYFSSLPGIIVAGFALGYWETMAQTMRPGRASADVEDVGKPYQHVMTPEKAVLWQSFLIEQSLRFITLTREDNLVDLILGAMGRWLFRLLQRFELILKLLRLEKERDFVRFFMDMKSARVGSALVIAVAALLAFIVVLSTATTGMLMLGGSILEPKAWQQFVLFSKHPRKKERVKISRRVGGVAP